jgi:hypothetical protein
MKLRLSRIAAKLGYNATPEHAPTLADVFVREAKGLKVCWLIREGLDSEKALKALFGLPAVRFRVVDRDDPGRLVAPWNHPSDRKLARRARLEVFGTIAYTSRADKRGDPPIPDASWFHTGSMDGLQFLE